MSRKKKMNKSLITLILIGILILVLQAYDYYKAQFTSDSMGYEVCSVIRIIDGDTFIVRLNTKEQKVRLIGINSPELNEYYGEEAKAYLEERLDNKTIYMTKDISEQDKYGRLLRYVWLDKSSMQDQISPNNLLNAHLLAQGYAKVMTIEPDVKYQKEFERIEETAESHNSGLWNN